MPYLLYCLFAGQSPPPLPALPGVGGGEVEVVGLGDMGAAVSWMDAPSPAPPVADLLDYGKVVEAFHEQRTVIPLRYGCLCRDRNQVATLLEAGRGRFVPLLAELAGCVEMGIRALLPREAEAQYGSRPKDPPSRAQCASRAKASAHPGSAYLSARLGERQPEARAVRKEDDLPARCRSALDGLFVRSICEGPVKEQGAGGDHHALLSLYFLVPRPKVSAFREAFAAFSQQESAKMMLSGPWPPYNFAAPAQCDRR